MTTPLSPSAKDKVLAWVRSKNPQTMEPKELCRYEWSNLDGAAGGGFIQSAKHWDAIKSHPKIDDVQLLGSDMGLQELLIAFRESEKWVSVTEAGNIGRSGIGGAFIDRNFVGFDLTKNLHQQPDEFYEQLLPLIPDAN